MTTAKLLELIAELEGSVVIECRAAVFRMELHDERVAKRREVHAAIRALAGEVERLRGKARVNAQMHDVYNLLAERDTLRAEVAALEKQVRLAAGMLSTTGRFADQHPEVALRYIQDSQAIDDAALAEKQP